MNIFILSAPIRSGKSTNLMLHFAQEENVNGIITPDVDLKRMFYDIKEKAYFPMQIDPNIQNNEEESIKVGRFLFSKIGFDRASKVLTSSTESKLTNLLIIDEIGKLELADKGFAQALTFILASNYNNNLLLVVRDFLVDDVIKKFNLESAHLFSLSQMAHLKTKLLSIE